MIAMGFTPTEIDQMTGKAIGHASSATFRTSDLVGLDVLVHVNNNLYPAFPEDDDREIFLLPELIETSFRKSFSAIRRAEVFIRKQRMPRARPRSLS